MGETYPAVEMPGLLLAEDNRSAINSRLPKPGDGGLNVPADSRQVRLKVEVIALG
jgi:hypothetical protein